MTILVSYKIFTSKCYGRHKRFFLGFSTLDGITLLKQDSIHITETIFSHYVFIPNKIMAFFQSYFSSTKKKKRIKNNLLIIPLSRLEERKGKKKPTNTQKLASYRIANHLPLNTNNYFLPSPGKVQPLFTFVLQNKYNWFFGI